MSGTRRKPSEGTSNDAVVVSLRRSVGGHARIGASESNSPEQKRNLVARNGSTKTTVISDGLFGFGDIAWRPVTQEGWKPTVKRRSERERIYGQKAGEE